MDEDGTGSGEHPFANWLRIVGKGPGRGRALDRQEARDAFAAILERRAEDLQVGAFLLLLRYRGETPEELAGFVEAARNHHGWPPLGGPSAADLDWPSYATGPSRGAPWFLLSALLLARAGVRVLMHGVQPPDNPRSAEAIAARLGLPTATGPSEAAAHLRDAGFAYVPLRFMAPALDRLMGMRPLLGLRTPVNSLLKLVNPAAAPAVIQGVFHPPYLDLHARAAAALGQPRSSVFKGGRGEAERNPLKACTVRLQHGEAWSDLEWPPLLGSGRGERPEPASPDHLLAVWRREAEDPVGEASVLGTAAIALATARPGTSPEDALRTARELWTAR
ncbi:glycosyl transferase family protein [Arenibaculum sp.]|uniref:glycosyl transferase family protein n=1 Tax=Arenibaculum sp. TaxID=2865862 RepID=UPI002E0FCE42|nr:glycosyl transferase family protein [Arenibaculum sp.]